MLKCFKFKNMTEKTRNLLKPFSYKNIADFTPEEIKKLSQALGCSPSYLSNHLNHEKSPILDFHTLIKIDNLFQHQFQDGVDISYIVSVADWADHSFKRVGKPFNCLFEDYSWYYRKEAKYFFDLKNSETVLKNFIQYNEEFLEKESSWKEEKKHEFLPPFCEKMIESYCYNKFEKKEDEINKKSFELFLLSFNFLKTTYIKEKLDQSDKKYFARICLKFLSHAMIYSKNKIDEKNELSILLLEHINPHFSSLWESISFIVKNNLFDNIKIDSESFNISKSLLFSLNKSEFENEIKKSFLHNEKIKNIDKILHFFNPIWTNLSIKEFSQILNKCLNNDHFAQTQPLFLSMGVKEEYLQAIQKNNNNHQIQELIFDIIKANICKEKLEIMFSKNDTEEKKIKI